MRPAPLAFLILTAGCDGGLPEIVSAPPWSLRFGDGGDQAVLVAAVDTNGDTALAGTYTGSIDLGGGPLPGDFEAATFVATFDALGHHRWSVPIIGGHLSVRGIAPARDGWVLTAGYSDRTVVAGTVVDAFGDDVLLAALDDAGKVRWIKHWSADDGGPTGIGIADPVAGVAVDARGNIVVAGEFSGTFGFGGATIDALGAPGRTFVAGFDAAGRERWATAYGDADVGTYPEAMALDPGGDVVVVGGRAGGIGTRGFVARFDEHGQLRHERVFGGSGVSVVHSITVDPRGDVIVAGLCDGEVDIGSVTLSSMTGTRGFVAALSADGKVRWASTIGEDDGSSNTVAASVVAGDAGVIVGGLYSGFLPGLPDRPNFNRSGGFLVEIGDDGKVGRLQALSPTDGDTCDAPLLALSGGDLVVAGGFQGALTRGSETLRSAGGRDAFVSRAPR